MRASRIPSTNSSYRRLASWGVLLLFAGCGSAHPTDRPETVPVKVTIVYHDQPVEGAVVSFIDDVGHAASTVTDGAGEGRLWTFVEDDGVVPGFYQVTVQKMKIMVTDDPDDPEEAPPLHVERTHLLPPRYGSIASTNLTAEVAAKGAQSFRFELND